MTFLFVCNYRSAWQDKTLKGSSADLLHRASPDVCTPASVGLRLRARPRETPPRAPRILKEGAERPGRLPWQKSTKRLRMFIMTKMSMEGKTIGFNKKCFRDILCQKFLSKGNRRHRKVETLLFTWRFEKK